MSDLASLDTMTRAQLESLVILLEDSIRLAPDRWAAGTAIQSLADVRKRLAKL